MTSSRVTRLRVPPSRICSGRFLGLLDDGLPEPLILELDELTVGNFSLSLSQNMYTFCSPLALSLIGSSRVSLRDRYS